MARNFTSSGRRSNRPGKCRWGLLCLLVVTAAVLRAPGQVILWDGGFTRAEYRLTFTDEAGRPVPGVLLRVQTRGGSACPLYPIDEFFPGQAPASDAQGRMVFHHVGAGLEFGGRESSNLLGMRFGDTGAPRYDLVFSVGGREVYRLPYDDLRPRGEEVLPTVTREWHHPEWPLHEYVAHQDDWSAHRHRLFDGNRDGKLDREEGTAAGYFERLIDPPEPGHRKRAVQFVVVERAITLSMP
jgi:hypothetical protein